MFMSNELNFYEVGAYGYEECIEKQYYSYEYYQQEEFEKILFEVMKELMGSIVKNEPSSLCYYNIFFSPDDLLLHERFDELMEDRGFFRLKNKINVRVGFELDNRYENQYNNDLKVGPEKVTTPVFSFIMFVSDVISLKPQIIFGFCLIIS